MMKIIKDLTVKVTYRVRLENVEVSDKVYDELSQCYDEGREVFPNGITDEESFAFEWLSDNIREDDAMEWRYDIEEFEEYFGTN